MNHIQGSDFTQEIKVSAPDIMVCLIKSQIDRATFSP